MNVAQTTREGVETLQTKRELSQTYGELGRKTAELVESGAITHPDSTPLVERIGELKAQLAADAAAEEAPEPDDSPAPQARARLPWPGRRAGVRVLAVRACAGPSSGRPARERLWWRLPATGRAEFPPRAAAAPLIVAPPDGDADA